MSLPSPAAAHAPIPVGVATQAGLAGALATLGLAAAALFTDRSAESVGAFGSAAAILIATVLGRMAQARTAIASEAVSASRTP